MMLDKAVIFDLDGTLCDVSHRVHYMQRKPKEKEKFHAACVLDAVNTPVYDLYRIFKRAGYKIIIMTCRPIQFKPQTEYWLKKHNIQFDELIMSTAAMPDAKNKFGMYIDNIKFKYDVIFAVEDRTSVVNMWRDIGITCLDVAGNDF